MRFIRSGVLCHKFIVTIACVQFFGGIEKSFIQSVAKIKFPCQTLIQVVTMDLVAISEDLSVKR